MSRSTPLGNAVTSLDITWDNGVMTPAGKPYRELPGNKDLRNLGIYFRLLVPERSSDRGGLGWAARGDHGAGCRVPRGRSRPSIGTYLLAPPGQTSLRYVWTSPCRRRRRPGRPPVSPDDPETAGPLARAAER